MQLDASPETRDASGGRLIAMRVVASLLALLLLSFGGQLLVAGWFSTTDGGIHKVHELGWGVLEGLLMVVPLVALLWSPLRRVAAVQQMGAAIAALMVAMVLTAEFDLFTIGIAVLVGLVAWLHPGRSRLLKAGAPSKLLTGISAVGAVPLVIYALGQAAAQRGGVGGSHADLNHWVGMSAAALAIVLVSFVASLKAPGWRIPLWTAGLGAFTLGLASILYPDQASSFGSVWGVAALAGGFALISAGEAEARSAA